MGRSLNRWLVVWSMVLATASGACSARSEAGARAPSRDYGGGPMTASYGGDSVRSESDEEAPPADAPMAEPMPVMAYPQQPMGTAAPPAPPGAKTASGNGTGSSIDDPERKQPILIYTADFTLSVYEVTKSLDAVEGLARDAGGFMSRREDRSVTIRVPAQKFQEVVLAIEKIGDVLHRNVVSEDVTAEYRDLEVQLANALAMRLRFEKLLEKAVKVEEALAIERELGRITGDIERIKGRLKLLGDLARYSTITVTFNARSSEVVQEGPFFLPLPWLNNVSLPRLLNL